MDESVRCGVNVLPHAIYIAVDKKLTSLSEQARRALRALTPKEKRTDTIRKTLDACPSVTMSHQPYQPLPAQPHGGDTDPNETRRQQNVWQSNGQMSRQSHGGDTDPNEIRRAQFNTQTSMGQQSSSQYTQASQHSTISSPNISRPSSQATQQQAYQPPPQVPVWYGGPESGQPQPQHSQAANYQGTRRRGAHYVPVSSEIIQRRFKN